MQPREHSSKPSLAHQREYADLGDEQLQQPYAGIEEGTEMSKGRIFLGQLKGNDRSATCSVRVGANGDDYISDVTPSLPDGEYNLFVDRIFQRVRRANGRWSLITE